MFNLAYNVQDIFLKLIGRARYYLLERYYIYTIRAGIVLVTLLLTSLTALMVARKGVMGLALLGGVAGLVALIFIYNYLEVGLFLLLITSTIVNPALPKDVTVTLVLLMALLGVWFFRLIITERSFRAVRPAAPNKFIFLFIIAVVVSYVWSTVYVDPQVRYFQEDKFMPRLLTGIVLILSPLTVLLYGNLLRSLKDIKRLIWYYIIYGSVMIVVFMISTFIFSFPIPLFINIGGQLSVWTAILALGQAFFNKGLNRWQTFGLLLVAGLWLFYQFVVSSGWVSGWVPLVLGLTIIVFLRSRLLFIFLLILGSIYIAANFDIVNELVVAEQAESGNSRVSYGSEAIDIANQHFLFGTGPTGYYFYMVSKDLGLFQLSHNNLIDIYAQTGIFGFVTWALMWFSIGWMNLRVYLSSPPGGFTKGLAASLVAIFPVTILLMLLGDWITPFTYTQSLRGFSYTIWPWIWAGVSLALFFLVHRQQLVSSTAAD